MSDPSSLAAALASLSADGGGARQLLAVGWATVDAERTASELGGVELVEADPEPALGAHAWVARTGSIDLVVLEPATEGYLAAHLARHGEGIAVLYVSSAAAGRVQPTALGRPGRLVRPNRLWGPFVIAVEPASTG
jgi:hypothetical protein